MAHRPPPTPSKASTPDSATRPTTRGVAAALMLIAGVAAGLGVWMWHLSAPMIRWYSVLAELLAAGVLALPIRQRRARAAVSRVAAEDEAVAALHGLVDRARLLEREVANDLASDATLTRVTEAIAQVVDLRTRWTVSGARLNAHQLRRLTRRATALRSELDRLGVRAGAEAWVNDPGTPS